MSKQIRHGDILLVPVAAPVPVGAPDTRREVLAEGEMTGHAHTLTAERVVRWQDFVVGYGSPVLDHQEHGSAALVDGQVYRVVQQREYTLTGMWQRVAD